MPRRNKIGDKPTEKQYDTLVFISEYRKTNGYSPTIMDINENFSITNRSSSDRIQALRAKGYIDITMKAFRTIIITEEGENLLRKGL